MQPDVDLVRTLPQGRQEYGFGARLRGLSLERARACVTEALAAEGFGVVTALDMRSTFADKLGIETRPYVILGVCNPALAHRALTIEPYVGLLLPCNVTLWEDDGEIVITFANPSTMLRVSGDARLTPIAEEAERRLRGALRRLD